MKLHELTPFLVKGMKLSENSENMSFRSANLIDGCTASKGKIPFFKKGIKQIPFFSIKFYVNL